MLDENLSVLILAAGKGKRMYSQKPKVLQKIGGKPIILHLLETLQNVNISQIGIVYGHKGEEIKSEIAKEFPNLKWIEQKEQLGTAHAVMQAMPIIPREGSTLILLGDCPFIEQNTIENLIISAQNTGCSLLTAALDNPFGYGRIIRKEGFIYKIVEEKDASAEEKLIREVNTGVMLLKNEYLHAFLPQIKSDNNQSEYYLTDLIEIIAKNNGNTVPCITKNTDEIIGINNKQQLAEAEKIYRQKQANILLNQGVSLIDPERIDIFAKVKSGQDVTIEANVTLKGEVYLGNNVYIETGCILQNCQIEDNAHIHAYSIIEDARVCQNAQIGPFARLRPHTSIKENAKIGNFVEIKASEIGVSSKVNHLSYIGDAIIGEEVNIGAGTITCNYDGANKHKTIIGNNVFIGSNSSLIAPINIADGATIGAGSAISKNIAAKILAFTRPALREIKDWVRPSKKDK